MNKLKQTLISLKLLAFLALFASNVSATVITFDEPGVFGSFTSSDGSILAEWVWGIGTADGHHHSNTDSSFSGKYEDGHGQAYQGIRFSSVVPGSLTLDSFDLRGSWLVGLLNDGSGTLYSAGTEGSGAWTTQSVGLTSSSYIYIYANGQIGAGDLDNVTFNTNPVPEPASIALLGLGLAGLGFSRKKKRT